MALNAINFLLLPAEIRNHIYRLLLLSPEIQWNRHYVSPFVNGSSGMDRELSYATGLHSTILATCRTIAFEASPILYGHNTFGLFLPEVSFFVQMIGPQNKNLLRDVQVFMKHLVKIPDFVRWDKAFRHCSSLRRLHFFFEFLIADGLEGSPDEQSRCHESVFVFFKRAQKLLNTHSSLKLAMSSYPMGQERTHSNFKVLLGAFAASREDLDSDFPRHEDAIMLNLDVILNAMREKTHQPLRR